MTLPNRPYDNAEERPLAAASTPLLAPEELTEIIDADYAHVDYDRHPLSVRRLDHYIEGPLGDGRFHVSG